MKKNIKIYLLAAAVLASVAAGSVSSASVTLTNPISYTSVEDVGMEVLTFLREVVGVLAVVFIVIGGILYITSRGDSGQTETAKKAITAACIGLALVLAGPSFVETIYVDILDSDLTAIEGEDPISIPEIAMNVLEFLLSVAGTLAVLAIVYGGVTYFTAAVDTKQADTAKQIILYSVVGIVVILLSLSIVKWVGDALGTT